MICRPDLRLILAATAVLALVPPAAAAPGGDPLVEAAEALDRGDGIAAEVAARRALDAGYAHERVAAFAGEAELQQGDLSAARNWLGEGRFDAASAQRGYHALALLEVADGNIAAAGHAFDTAFAQGPENAGLWVDIGRFRYGNGQHYLAVAAADRALEVDPADARALEFRGQLLRDAEGVRAAREWFATALDKVPGDLGLLGEYAATLGEAGEYREMLRVARRMVELDPRQPRAYFLQAVLAARAGNDNLARRLLWRTDGAYDDVPAGRLLAGILELRTGNAALAVDQFDALVRRQPDNARAALLLGRALLAAGDANEVVARFAPAASRADASPYLLTLVGRAYEQLDRRAEAAPYLDRAATGAPAEIGVLPVDADELWRTGSTIDQGAAAVPLLRDLLARGDGRGAVTLANSLGEHYDGSADIARLRGDVALLAGDPSGALRHYADAARIRQDWSLVERMIAAQRMLGRKDAALALAAGHVARNPGAGRALAALGRMLAGNGERERAVAILAHAPTTGDPLLLGDLAQAELAAGDGDAARSAARQAYALQRSNGRVAEILARTLQASEPRQAEALLAKARSSAPQLASR
jgi:tetratricopeptide (TPR) repeat protein